MDLSKLTRQAKKVVDKRGGMQSVIEDAKELKNIVGQHESLSDKAKAAAAALKDPGRPGSAGEPESAPPQTAPAPAPEPAPAPPDQPS